jgi:hypothetical protein
LEIRKGLLNEIEIFFCLAIELSKNKQKRKYLYCQFLRKQHAIAILLFDKWEKSEKNGRKKSDEHFTVGFMSFI